MSVSYASGRGARAADVRAADVDVGVAEEFLDDDEVAPLFQEQGGSRVPEVVEADDPESRAAEEAAEAAGEVGGVERLAVRGGEDESVARPARSGRLALFLLSFLVNLEATKTSSHLGCWVVCIMW